MPRINRLILSLGAIINSLIDPAFKSPSHYISDDHKTDNWITGLIALIFIPLIIVILVVSLLKNR